MSATLAAPAVATAQTAAEPVAEPMAEPAAEQKLRLYPRQLKLHPGGKKVMSAWTCPADDRSPYGPDREPGTDDDDCSSVRADWSVKDDALATLSNGLGPKTRVTLVGDANTRVIVRHGNLRQAARVAAKDEPAAVRPAAVRPAAVVVTSERRPKTQSRRVYRVLSRIDATGSRDVSSELQAFINNTPNGSTIVFKAGGTYRLGGVVRIGGKRNLTLAGNGATLKLTGPGGQAGAGIFVEQQSVGTTIRNLTIVGNHDAAGTAQACCGREGQHGIGVFSSDRTLIEKVDISRIGGDCFYVEPSPADNPPEGVTVRDSTCRLTGRHGVMLEGGTNILVEDSHFDKIGYDVIDIEPGNPVYGIRNFVFRNNTIGSYGLNGIYDSFFLSACDAPWNTQGSSVIGVTITGNTIEAGRSGWNGAMLGLQTLVCGDRGPNTVREDFMITNNVAKSTVDGAWWGVMRFTKVNGVTVTGNTQPLRSSRLAAFPNCSRVTYRR